MTDRHRRASLLKMFLQKVVEKIEIGIGKKVVTEGGMIGVNGPPSTCSPK